MDLKSLLSDHRRLTQAAFLVLTLVLVAYWVFAVVLGPHVTPAESLGAAFALIPLAMFTVSGILSARGRFGAGRAVRWGAMALCLLPLVTPLLSAPWLWVVGIVFWGVVLPWGETVARVELDRLAQHVG